MKKKNEIINCAANSSAVNNTTNYAPASQKPSIFSGVFRLLASVFMVVY